MDGRGKPISIEPETLTQLGVFYVDFVDDVRVGDSCLRLIEPDKFLGVSELPAPDTMELCSDVDPADRPELLRSIKEFLTGEVDELKVEYKRRNKDNSTTNIMATAVVDCRDQNGRPLAIVGHEEDATELDSLRARVAEQDIEGVIGSTEAEALQTACAVVVSSLNASEAVASVVDQLKSIAPFDSAMVCELENRVLTFVGGSPDVTQENWKHFARQRLRRVHRLLETRSPDVVVSEDPGTPHLLLAPIVWRSQVMGVLVMNRIGEPFEAPDAMAAMRMSEFLSIALSNARMYRIMRQRAEIDQLSGVLTRQAFMEAGEKSADSTFHAKKPVSCLMLDIDHFKSINDTYGHAVGDEVIRTLGAVISESLRSTDMVGRFGGEEFCAILTDTDLETGVEVAERLRKKVEATRFEGVKRPVTASIGVAGLTEEAAEEQRVRLTIEQMVTRADAGLYQAKEGGRNQVIHANLETPFSMPAEV